MESLATIERIEILYGDYSIIEVEKSTIVKVMPIGRIHEISIDGFIRNTPSSSCVQVIV